MMPRGLTNVPRGHGGLTPQERLIMADWDRGLPVRAIARARNLPLAAVRRTVAYYHGGGEEAKARRDATAGSRRLASLILRHVCEAAAR
ncbi:hypothetical protein [Sphingopyxis sp. SCN 67-31]|uniref:hypothetical protein n=1 Tax=Sphingopyxis sp. SCN 67-31 TaxID=1660142 RepID=UPI00086B7D8A|nr:hypothetical protein [Sphingopyxis sp. SCN 67-31]ODU29009.1 MAG: hypothetical protein ABS88_10790 [Sphingopyxis sp. SCN 67-31]